MLNNYKTANQVIRVGVSNIAGHGKFARVDIKSGQVVYDLSISNGYNHSCDPNAMICDVGIVAIKDIQCGSEITVGYIGLIKMDASGIIWVPSENRYVMCNCFVCNPQR